jgi:uracil-DNA glycosylase
MDLPMAVQPVLALKATLADATHVLVAARVVLAMADQIIHALVAATALGAAEARRAGRPTVGAHGGRVRRRMAVHGPRSLSVSVSFC